MLVLVFASASPCAASIVSILPPDWTESRVLSEVGRGNIDAVVITSLDTTYRSEVSLSPREYSRIDVTVTESSIRLNVDMSWGVPERDVGWSSAYLHLSFTVGGYEEEPLYYSISGAVSFQDPYGADSRLNVFLPGMGPVGNSFRTDQRVRQTGNFDLDVRSSNLGNQDSERSGSLDGILEPGHPYDLFVRIHSSDWTDNVGSPEPSYVASRQMQEEDLGPITALGSLVFKFSTVPIPEPSILITLATALCGPLLMRRRVS